MPQLLQAPEGEGLSLSEAAYQIQLAATTVVSGLMQKSKENGKDADLPLTMVTVSTASFHVSLL